MPSNSRREDSSDLKIKQWCSCVQQIVEQESALNLDKFRESRRCISTNDVEYLLNLRSIAWDTRLSIFISRNSYRKSTDPGLNRCGHSRICRSACRHLLPSGGISLCDEIAKSEQRGEETEDVQERVARGAHASLNERALLRRSVPLTSFLGTVSHRASLGCRHARDVDRVNDRAIDRMRARIYYDPAIDNNASDRWAGWQIANEWMTGRSSNSAMVDRYAEPCRSGMYRDDLCHALSATEKQLMIRWVSAVAVEAGRI